MSRNFVLSPDGNFWIIEAAYWLDRRASGNTYTPFYHSILSNYPQDSFAVFTEDLPVNTCSPTTFPERRPTQLFSSFIRYYRFAKSFCWELLTLLSLSRSFRCAATDLSEIQWERLLGTINQNGGSFELISKTTRPEYGTLLTTMFRILGIVENIVDNPSDAWMAMNNWIYKAACTNYGGIDVGGLKPGELDSPMSERYLSHPQRWFVALDKKSIFPVDPVYIPIEESLIYTQDFMNENDPRYIGGDCAGLGVLEADRRNMCEHCEVKCLATCSCTFGRAFPEPLVEIIETDGKGLGVRSLQVCILLSPILFALFANALIRRCRPLRKVQS